jgi:hypothetical protein
VQLAFLDAHSLKGILGAHAVPFFVRGRPRLLGVENMLASVNFGIFYTFIFPKVKDKVCTL